MLVNYTEMLTWWWWWCCDWQCDCALHAQCGRGHMLPPCTPLGHWDCLVTGLNPPVRRQHRNNEAAKYDRARVLCRYHSTHQSLLSAFICKSFTLHFREGKGSEYLFLSEKVHSIESTGLPVQKWGLFLGLFRAY